MAVKTSLGSPWYGKTKLTVPLIEQRHNTNCGPASLTMVLQFYQQKVREQDIELALKLIHNGHPIAKIRGTHRSHLVNIARTFGLIAHAKANRTIKDLEIILSKGIPVIARIRGFKGWQHYTVITGYDKKRKRLFCNDPYTQMRSISYEEFRWLWNIPKTWTEQGTRNYAITFRQR